MPEGQKSSRLNNSRRKVFQGTVQEGAGIRQSDEFKKLKDICLKYGVQW